MGKAHRSSSENCIGVANQCEDTADPGQSTSLSPYCKLNSMYFDDSLYENEGHLKMKRYRDEDPRTADDIYIDSDDNDDYNTILDKLSNYSRGKFRFFGVSNKPHELVIEDDPRDKYKKFDEKYLEGGSDEEEDKK